MINSLRGLLRALPHRPKHLKLWPALALACAFTACPKAPSENPDVSTSTHEKSPPLAIRTEAGWIVQSITEEIVRLAAYAAKLDPGAFLMAQTHGHPSAAQFKEVLGRYLEYYQMAMLDYAALVKNDPAEYVAITRRLAQQDPGYFLVLGNYFVAHRQEKEAVEAFENGFTHHADAVQLSNECDWLVTYYATHNRADRALEIAKSAADVYSYGGLATMARLMERLGEPKEAEEYYLKIQERYGNASLLPGFYYRQLSKDPNSKFAGKYAQIEKEFFPDKPRRVAVSDFTAPPHHGVLIPVSNDLLARSGLKASDVIVAIDGKQVDNSKQYAFIRDLTLSDELDLIVYSGGKYRGVHATAPGRLFGFTMENYTH